MRIPLNNKITGWEDFSKVFTGKLIGIHSILLEHAMLILEIDPEGVQAHFHNNNLQSIKTDLTITVYASSLAGLFFQASPKVMIDKGMIKINGDIKLADSLQQLSFDLATTISMILAKVIGTTASALVVDTCNSFFLNAQRDNQLRIDDLTRYVFFTLANLPTKQEAHTLYQAIQSLKNKVDRLEQQNLP
ncbi:MAG: hypothetical protein QM538_06495 [Methylacidiphilales bacterium]|nr:hypothetical protein [Candidatus Methylacidiphilales bacterium]